MHAKNKDIHDTVIHRILRLPQSKQVIENDKQYAQLQLKKIYSQQLSKMMQQKKHYLLFDRKRNQLDQELEVKQQRKLENISRMQEKSIERRNKIKNQRLKLYRMHDKDWALKTQAIKDKFKHENKQMAKVADQYRERSQFEWKQRQSEHKNRMKQFSERQYALSTNKMSTSRTSNHSQLFNKKKLDQLLRKKQTHFKTMRKSQSIDLDIRSHQEKQYSLSQSKSKEQLSKLVHKLDKMEKKDTQREQQAKKQSLERSKRKLHQKTYQSSRPEIGSPCQKHQKQQARFRIKTQENEHSSDRIRSRLGQDSAMRLSTSLAESAQKRKEKEWQQYLRKSRRIKISRILTKNVRTALQSQFRSSHLDKLF